MFCCVKTCSILSVWTDQKNHACLFLYDKHIVTSFTKEMLMSIWDWVNFGTDVNLGLSVLLCSVTAH